MKKGGRGGTLPKPLMSIVKSLLVGMTCHPWVLQQTQDTRHDMKQNGEIKISSECDSPLKQLTDTINPCWQSGVLFGSVN